MSYFKYFIYFFFFNKLNINILILFISVPGLKVILGIFLIWFYSFFFCYIKKDIKGYITEYKITSLPITILFNLLFLIYWILFIGYIIYKLLQNNNDVNLKILLQKLNNIPFDVLISNIIFIFGFLCILISIFSFLKRKVFQHFLKLKIYIRKYIPDNDVYNNKYDNFLSKFTYYFAKIWKFPLHVLLKINVLSRKQIYEPSFEKYWNLLDIWKRWCPLILLIFFILFDLFLNNFVLTKYYYILLFISFYRFVYLLEQAFFFTTPETDVDIYHFLYDKIIEKTFDGFYFESGYYLSNEDFKKCCDELQKV